MHDYENNSESAEAFSWVRIDVLLFNNENLYFVLTIVLCQSGFNICFYLIYISIHITILT